MHDVLLTRKGRWLYRRPGDHGSAHEIPICKDIYKDGEHSLHSLDVQSTKIWKMEIYSDYILLINFQVVLLAGETPAALAIAQWQHEF